MRHSRDLGDGGGGHSPSALALSVGLLVVVATSCSAPRSGGSGATAETSGPRVAPEAPAAGAVSWFEALAGFHEVSGVRRMLDEAAATRSSPLPGDEVAYELTLDLPRRSRRWDLRFRVAEIDADASQALVGRTPMDIFVQDDVPERATRRSQDSIRTTHLTTGLFAGAAVVRRVREQRRAITPDEEVRVGRAIGSLLGILDVLRGNDELAPILWEVVQKPPIWTVLTGGIEIEVEIGAAKRWLAEIPEGRGPAFRLAVLIRVNSRPALRMSAIVIEPRAPLTTGAGILSLVVERPDGSGTRARLRLTGGRVGAGSDATPDPIRGR